MSKFYFMKGNFEIVGFNNDYALEICWLRTKFSCVFHASMSEKIATYLDTVFKRA